MIAVQHVIIGFVFLISIYILARKVYKIFTAKSSCEQCSGACSTIDVNKIEQAFLNRIK